MLNIEAVLGSRAWVRFSDDQYEAVVKAAELARLSPRIQELLGDEVSQLADTDAHRIIADQKLLSQLYEGRPHMHAVLALLLRLPWLREQYAAAHIPDQVLIDTLTDIPIWMEVCKRRTGEWGLIEYGWLTGHFRFRLFRLGRLQFVLGHSEVPASVYRHTDGEVIALAPDGLRYTVIGERDGTNGIIDPHAWTSTLREETGYVVGHPIDRRGLAIWRPVALPLNEWKPALMPGDPILEIHVAEGVPLDLEAVRNSLMRAPEFFRTHLGVSELCAFTCESWLMDWALPEMVPNGNLAGFQRLFYCVPIQGSDHQTMERAFGGDVSDWDNARQDTTLRRAIRARYLSGKRCRNAYGFILID